jgi:hypothetical protein
MDRASGPFHATAELASVERCSAPETRPPKAQPRHHAACQRGAVFTAEGRGSPSDATRHAVLNTAPPAPSRYPAGRWRGVPRSATFWLRTRLHADKQHGGPRVCGRTSNHPGWIRSASACYLADWEPDRPFGPRAVYRRNGWFCKQFRDSSGRPGDYPARPDNAPRDPGSLLVLSADSRAIVI